MHVTARTCYSSPAAWPFVHMLHENCFQDTQRELHILVAEAKGRPKAKNLWNKRNEIVSINNRPRNDGSRYKVIHTCS